MKVYVNDRGFAVIECPGCKTQHLINVSSQYSNNTWYFNGDQEKPTFSPCVRVTWTFGEEYKVHCCHFDIKDGKIQYWHGCTHDLSGIHTDLPEITKTTR